METANEVIQRREYVAERLLAASAKLSFDPNVVIDWNAPFDDNKFFLPERRCSLYGTPTWDTMSRRERIELSKHELANGLTIGIWGEVILMQMLIRHAYDEDLSSAHFRYALTEIGDECRHSVMFSRMIEKLGCPTYEINKFASVMGRMLKTVSNPTTSFVAAVWLEETTDVLQREAMADEDVQPLVREMARIHVVEEARHIRYGQDEGARQWKRLIDTKYAFASRAWTRLVIALGAGAYLSGFANPDVYTSVGLPGARTTWSAMRNPNAGSTLRTMSKKALAYSDELGLYGRGLTKLFAASDAAT